MIFVNFVTFLTVKNPTYFRNQNSPSNRARLFQNTETAKPFQDSFNEELNTELLKIDVNKAEFSEFNNAFVSVLNKHISKRQKYVRANKAKFMNKTLRKVILTRTRLRNKFLEEKTEKPKNVYNKQRNFSVSLLHESKRVY